MQRNRVVAVVWKEWHELFRLDQGLRSVGLRVGAAAAVGVILAWRAGATFGRDASTVLLLIKFTLLPTLPITPDSFAGERERHTLETLLASPITEGEIFLGKFLAILAIGVGFTLFGCVSNIVAIAARYGFVTLTQLNPSVLATGIAMGLLIAAILVGLGMIMSVHVRTVRSANQISAYSLVALIFIGSAVSRSLPASFVSAVSRWNENTPLVVRLGGAIVLLSVFAIAILFTGIATFNRRRLFEND
jgi:ABC-2 type transport system permease protein